MDYKEKLIQLLNSKELTKEEEERLCKIFPELAESEDEQTKRELINYLYDVHDDDEERARWISYLEKQGEHANFRNKIQVGDKVTRNEDGVLVNLSQLNRVAKKDEKQAQKPAEWIQELESKLSNATPEQLAEWKEKYFKVESAWSEEDENYHRICLDLCTGMPNGGVYAPYIKDEAINWFKSLKDRCQPQPKQEWSDDDEKHIRSILSRLDTTFKDVFTDSPFTISEDIDWLESLPSLSHWKPSEEQMRVIDKTINFIICHDDIGSEYLCNKLNELKQQLKG